jgi:hypothetical protein
MAQVDDLDTIEVCGVEIVDRNEPPEPSAYKDAMRNLKDALVTDALRRNQGNSAAAGPGTGPRS